MQEIQQPQMYFFSSHQNVVYLEVTETIAALNKSQRVASEVKCAVKIVQC